MYDQPRLLLARCNGEHINFVYVIEGDGKVKQRSHATIVAYYSLGGVLLAVIVIICGMLRCIMFFITISIWSYNHINIV